MVFVESGFIKFDMDPDSGSSPTLIRIWIRWQGNDSDYADPDLLITKND